MVFKNKTLMHPESFMVQQHEQSQEPGILEENIFNFLLSGEVFLEYHRQMVEPLLVLSLHNN